MSIEINLLPWREQQRARRSRRFHLAVVCMVVLGVGGALGVTALYQQEVEAQQARNAHIAQKMDRLNEDIRSITEYEAVRERMLSQIDVFSELQQGRSQTVQVFRDLTVHLVDGVHYREMNREGDRLRLTGFAETNRQVSDQLRALAAAPSLAEPVLSEVETISGTQRRFTLNVSQLQEQEDQRLAGAPGETP